MEGMEGLERALKTTRLLLEDVLEGSSHEATMNPSSSKKPRRALKLLLSVFKANSPPRDLLDIIGDLKDTTDEIFACQQNNERVFKLVWYRYVVSQQRIGRPSSVYNFGTIEDGVWRALDSVLRAFYVYPFAISPEKIHLGYDSHILAILNHNLEATTRHEELARRIGKAWVDDRLCGCFDDSRVQDLGTLQTLLYELLWSGALEQLRQESACSGDPEQLEFERVMGELERVLQKAVVRLREQPFTIALCGTVDADKSLFLNALVGRAIFPLDGESYDPQMPHPMLSTTAELPSTAWPCRFRHVEGQKCPVLQFQAEPFLVALKELQARQYSRKMQSYQPPPEDMFEGPLLSDALSDPSDEAMLLRMIHSQWVSLHAVTRDNLLKFETPGFEFTSVTRKEGLSGPLKPRRFTP